MNSTLSLRPSQTAIRIAEIIRRNFNANVGILGPEGILTWLGSIQSVFIPECDEQAANCQSHYQTWFEMIAKIPSRQHTLSCPAGFGAIAVPVIVQGECPAAIFASGIQDLSSILPAHNKLLFDLLTEISLNIQEQLIESSAQSSSANSDATFPELIGHSDAIQALSRQLHQASSCNIPILLTGAPGSGKDMAARLIHAHSERKSGPFIIQNCGTASASELESELFGHKRGATLDAYMDKQGLFDIANNGTFYLDNIDQMPLSVQHQLAKLIENGRFCPKGDHVPHHVDVHIIASTRQDLRTLAAQGLFLEDLLYRLNILEIQMPTLGERIEDLEELTTFFLAKNSQQTGRPSKFLTKEALTALSHYDWPGNIRELENEITRMCFLSPTQLIDESQISKRIIRAHSVIQDTVSALTESPAPQEVLREFQFYPGQNIQTALEEIERRIISLTLKQNEGNRTKTAEILGISRRNLIRKIENLKIEE